jgi:hypothetical protein
MIQMYSRRNFLRASLVAGTLLPYGRMLSAVTGIKSKILQPVIHMTDLFHPHGDPDDHFDLACVFSLALQGMIELKGVGIDYPPAFRKGDPDIMAVAQLNRICGLNVPVCIGSTKLLSKKDDTLPDLSRRDSVCIRWLIEMLEKSDRPVAITVVGSATDVAIAAHREPELFRTKCSGIYLNSGGSHQSDPDMLEFNVKLNPVAYAALFDLPCPIYWFPCWHLTEERISGEWGTFYWMPHKEAFENVNSSIIPFFWYMFSQSQDPHWLRMLSAMPPEAEWSKILKERRGMWSTASLLMLAGLTVTKSGKIVSAEETGENVLFRMEPVKVQCEENGHMVWALTDKPTNSFIFHVLDVAAYPAAMTKTVNTLLCAFPK